MNALGTGIKQIHNRAQWVTWLDCLLPAALLGIFIYLFCSLWCFTTLPSSEAWHIYYVELVQQGNFPYRDFYYYLPPLPLFFDWLVWPFCGGRLYWYKVFCIIERVCIFEFVYFYLIRKTNNRWVAWFACAMGSVMFAGTVYDLGGDYNQTSYFLIVLVGWFVLRFVEMWGEKKYLLLAGVALGILFLVKQNSFMASAVINLSALLFLCAVKRDRNVLRYLVQVLLGMVLPLAITFAILATNGALLPYLEQTLLTSSKGSIWLILLGWVRALAEEKRGLVTAGILLLLAGVHRYVCLNGFVDISCAKALYGSRRGKRAVEVGMLVVGISAIYIFYKDFLGGLLKGVLMNPLVLVLVIAFSLLAWRSGRTVLNEEVSKSYLVSLALLCVIMVSIVLLCGRNANNAAKDLFNEKQPSALMLAVAYVMMAYLLYLVLCWAIECVTGSNDQLQANMEHLVFDMVGFISMYASAMGGGSTPTPLGLFAGAPIAIASLLESKTCCSRAKDMLLYLFAGVIVFSVCSQKATSSYSWWGWKEEPTWVERSECDIEGLRGFKLTDNERSLYEKIDTVIQVDAPDNPTILGFPYVTMFNWLSGTNRLGRFVPVLFYDVCSGEYAKQDAITLTQNEPDVVIWVDIPHCLTTHENVFNGGKRLGQRDIQDWFASVKERDYELMCQQGDFYVYVKKNVLRGSYRSIEDPTKINVTAVSGSS